MYCSIFHDTDSRKSALSTTKLFVSWECREGSHSPSMTLTWHSGQPDFKGTHPWRHHYTVQFAALLLLLTCTSGIPRLLFQENSSQTQRHHRQAVWLQQTAGKADCAPHCSKKTKIYSFCQVLYIHSIKAKGLYRSQILFTDFHSWITEI